jgi:hypothetical protein
MLMTVLTERKKVRFISGDTECAAWHYPGTNGACVIMAGGGAVTKEPGTDLFARRFHEAGFNVLAFDYRRLGESGGQPRQVIRIAANRAPRGELVQLPGGHYEPFLGQHEQAIEAELSFLRRHLLDNPPPNRAAPAESAPHRGGRA